ncbi:MAG: hypothetical protein GC182_08475 [Rhodopseudomonas sp.]|nr:hypothetical protein [Rhodopseudomonas sp.]
MTLYRKTTDGFELLSDADEAAARADVNSLFANDSGYEILLSVDEATAVRAQWAAGMTPSADELCEQVTVFCIERLAAGYADATTGKTWQCDADSVGKWTALASSAGFAILMNVNPAPPCDLIAADNSTMTLSVADAFALFNSRVMPWVSATILHARATKDAILAGNPPADITAGWP